MTPSRKRFHRHILALAVMSALSTGTLAQVSTATLKGQVSTAGAAAKAGVTVTATNRDNGRSYRTQTQANGSYVLVGLAPGRYDIRVGDAGSAATTVEVQVGETAALDLSLGSATERVTVVGSAQRQGVRDSQVGTQVSRRMIDAMPQATRNFMSAADLAPGVRFETNQSGDTKIRGGAQNEDAVNVYVDGVGQKNNILRGGINGQNSSEGNPFPQSAIAEYKVLTQNYKAEFDQLSSVAITAVTRSGTNELHGDVYINRLGSNWRAYSPKEQKDEAAGVARPSFSQVEAGFSLGGPIKEDVLHYFVAYDGKTIERPKQIVGNNWDKYPGSPGIISSLKAKTGPWVQKFTEHLFFGKVSAQLDTDQRLELSLKLRPEDGYRLENDVATPSTAVNGGNSDTRLDLKHEWTRGNVLNEARLGYEQARWNPQSDSGDPLVRYKYSPSNEIKNIQDILWTGGSPNAQDRGQKGFYFKNDLTYTGEAGHVVKGGLQLKAMKYALGGTAFRVDAVDTVVDTVTGLPYYDGKNCTGTNVNATGTQSDQCRITRAIPGADVNFNNQQIGLYIQDDWALSKQLELNLGVRWDYETNMLNNDYVTPADRVTALKGLDGRTYDGVAAPAGQTYAQSLAKGGINIDDYIATGNSRKAFMGAFAPRLGASYDLMGDRSTVIFGGWGRSYDRTMANHALDELQKNAQAGGEIWLVKNDFKMPYADQFSLGVRQAVSDWNVEATVSDIHAKNQFVWFGGNRDPQGGWGTKSPIDPAWGGPTGYGTLILGDFVGENRTTSLFLKAEKPYSRSSGWGATVAYTYAEAKTTNRDWTTDIFDWTYGRNTHGWNPSKDAEKHRLVLAGVADKLLPWDMSLSGKFTYGSGLPRRITSCAAGWSNCVSVEGDSDAFRQMDVGIAKDIKLGFGTLRLRADVLNLFNTVNWGYYDDWGGGPVAAGGQANRLGGDNLNLDTKTGLRGDMRTVKLTVQYSF
ncbi:MAG: hypothetical protein C4K60_15510 [Ideonella sp. MAG2]|nr:MAG: hypothetical protein C4K60_15510 [Ideonella sp. MAG2]